MTRPVDDPRQMPPLGWCAECIREATWMRAATMWQGTALCTQHTVYIAGVGDIDIEEQQAPHGKPQAVLEVLRHGMRQDAVQAGF